MSASPPDDPAPPRTLLGERYELLELIGRGGMAEVHRAHDRSLDRVVAVKLLAGDRRGDREDTVRLRDEARAAAALHHPHVVSVFDVGEDAGGLFVVMELVEGRTLREVLAGRGRLPEPEAAAVGLAVCEALAAAHGRGIVHRDVKPANIMVGDGSVKLTDFGIARIMADDGVTAPGVIVGTAAYMAPEQVRDGPVDGRTDLYALGVVLYELVTGVAPFAGSGSVDVASRRLYESPMPPRHLIPSLSREMDDLVLRALALEPAARHVDARDMAEELRPLAATAAPVPPVSPSSAPHGSSAQDRSGADRSGTDRPGAVGLPAPVERTRALDGATAVGVADGRPQPGERDPWSRVRVAGVVLVVLATAVLIIATLVVLARL